MVDTAMLLINSSTSNIDGGGDFCNGRQIALAVLLVSLLEWVLVMDVVVVVVVVLVLLIVILVLVLVVPVLPMMIGIVIAVVLARGHCYLRMNQYARDCQN